MWTVIENNLWDTHNSIIYKVTLTMSSSSYKTSMVCGASGSFHGSLW